MQHYAAVSRFLRNDREGGGSDQQKIQASSDTADQLVIRIFHVFVSLRLRHDEAGFTAQLQLSAVAWLDGIQENAERRHEKITAPGRLDQLVFPFTDFIAAAPEYS